MQPACLFRNIGDDYPDEHAVCSKYFDMFSNIGLLFREKLNEKTKRKLLARYSVLPFYKEVEYSIQEAGYELLNSYSQHYLIANFEYYNYIKKYTPETFFNLQDIPLDGPFVVKGVTNSRKFNWDTLMFAKTKFDAINIACDLDSDSLLSSQQKIVRRYVPLETFEIGVNGLRFTNEWRCFCYGTDVLSIGYYWSNSRDAEDINNNTKYRQEVEKFASKISKIMGEFVTFYAIDVARTENGDWIVIEINDGQMSGLSMNDPDILYRRLQEKMME